MNQTKYEFDKIQSNEIQLKQNTKIPKYKVYEMYSNKIQMKEYTIETKYKDNKGKILISENFGLISNRKSTHINIFVFCPVYIMAVFIWTLLYFSHFVFCYFCILFHMNFVQFLFSYIVFCHILFCIMGILFYLQFVALIFCP